jgi:hypothetical protein
MRIIFELGLALPPSLSLRRDKGGRGNEEISRPHPDPLPRGERKMRCALSKEREISR